MSCLTSAMTEFTNMWETAFDVTDTTFDCNVNRTNGDASTQLMTINHFLDKLVLGISALPAPDKASANTTNAASGVGSLGQQVSTCVQQHGRNPNFMLVDVSVFRSTVNQEPRLTFEFEIGRAHV